MKSKITMMLSGLLLSACMAKAQQGPPPGGQRPSPEEHLKRVTAKLDKDLTLSKEQSAKVAAAYKSFFESMEKVRKNAPPPPPPPPMPPGDKKKVDSLSAIRDAAIKKTLTAAQFTKYKEIEKTMHPPRPQGPPGGGPPPAPNKP